MQGWGKREGNAEWVGNDAAERRERSEEGYSDSKSENKNESRGRMFFLKTLPH